MNNLVLRKLFFMLLAFTVSVSAMADSLIKNPKTLRFLDMELPFRCSMPSSDEGEKVTSTIALSNMDFTVRLPGQTAPLPRYQVNGYTFSNKTVDVAVADLVKSLDIKVVPEEGKYLTLSACDLKGELTNVLEELMRQGGTFYTYRADTKTLFLTHKAKAIIQVPDDKIVMMAVLDALKGAHLDPISTDWSRSQITLNLTRPELETVQGLMASLINEKHILAVQIKLYTVYSKNSKVHWQKILDKFSTKDIASIKDGLIGQAFILKPNVDDKTFLSVVRNYFSPDFIATGKVVVPSGWKTRFNFNQCGKKMPYQDLSIFMRTSVKKRTEAQTVLTLDSKNGEIASFDMDNTLDQKIVLVGIPVEGYDDRELLISLQFQFIQLLRKGEQND